MYRYICINSFGFDQLVKLVTIIITLIVAADAKPYKSHRCLDWNFGGWSPMLYSLQQPISEPIYHRPSPPQIHHQSAELHPSLSKPNGANYIKKLKGPTHSWLPYYQPVDDDKSQAKVIRYNVRRPANQGKYPKYPHYLPTTVVHLKKAPANKQPNTKLNVYSVPIKPYSIKNLYNQPIIYEQLDYPLPNGYFSKHPSGYGMPSNVQTPKQKPRYPIVNQKQTTNHHGKPNKPKKTTVAAYIPVVEVPAIEHIEQHHIPLPNLNMKKPTQVYGDKIIEEHVYQIPNHVLHEIRHEINPKNVYPPKHQPGIQKMPIHLPGQAVSHVEQSYGHPPPPPHGYIEIGKPQILYEVSNYNSNYNHYQSADHKAPPPQLDGPPVFDTPYQMDNYAKAEDAGLFKPLLDKTRQANNYPKIGVVPYKNDPQNLNVIHLIANQKHLPMVVPITSIHTSNDGNYPIEHHEAEYPIYEKEIPSYSEKPYNYRKQQPIRPPHPPPMMHPPRPREIYSPQPSQYSHTENTYSEMKIEQEKSGYVEDEKAILQQLKNAKSPDTDEAYKEQQPQYVIHQTYSPISSLPDLQPPPPPPAQPETTQYQSNHNYNNNYNNENVHQIVEQIQVEQVKGNEYQQQEMRTVDYPVQQQEIKTTNDYTPVQQVEVQMKEQPITQIQQITTEYVKHEEPVKTIVQQQITDTGYNQPEQPPVQQQIQEVQIKDNYPTQDYKVKSVEEYGTRLPVTNYQYIKPSNLPAQPNGYHEQNLNSYESQTNDQSYVQQQQPIETTKTVQQQDTTVLTNDEQANIAAYEEARKSILQPLTYTTSNIYQQQPAQSSQEQSYDDGSYRESYLPPLSTSYDSPKANDYADDYSNNYESNNNNYRAESKGQEVKVDKGYNLLSNTAAEKVTINSGDNNNYNLKDEILTSEEQTNKKEYESLPEQKSSAERDEQPISELLNQRSESGQKYGERLVYVKTKKFKNLKMINGNTYLGDTLIYSASTRANTTAPVIRRRKIDEKVVAVTAQNVSSTDAPSIANSESTTVKPTDTVSIDTTNDANKTNSTSGEEIKPDSVVNFRPVSRADLRRIRRLRKEQGKLGDQLATSASEQIEMIDSNQFESSADAIDLDELKEADDLKAEESQLFHAYYGPADHDPEPGYVRLTVEQFKKIFKDAEIHVLNQDLNSSTTSGSTNSSILDNVNHLSSTTPAAQS